MGIHQEVDIDARPADIYRALTDSATFSQMTGGRSADISADAGGAISLFGGDIRGRNIELVPDARVVQAWRSQAWPEGVYSIVSFVLRPQGRATRLVFDQAGHPADSHKMLEDGWGKMYWQPMKALLAKA